MKKLILFAFVLFFADKNCKAQNLVPNPSFEEYTDCPHEFTQWGGQDLVQLATGWRGVGGNTADYFNACSHDSVVFVQQVGVPDNFIGHQYAASGVAYCGVVTHDMGDATYLEHIGTTLSSPLTVGEKYYVNMKVSYADHCFWIANGLGITFTTSNFLSDTFPFVYPLPKVICNNLIYDTANWVLISGVFIADSAYSYLQIGRFFSSLDTIAISYYYSMMQSYYYIDDVCVTTDSLGCDFSNYGHHDGIKKISDQTISIYPNPASDKIFISSYCTENFKYTLTNIFGEVVQSNTSTKLTIDVSDIPSGIYFLQVSTKNNLVDKKIIVKH